MLELKILTLVSLDFQTELSWAKALRVLLMRLATFADEPPDLLIIRVLPR